MKRIFPVLVLILFVGGVESAGAIDAARLYAEKCAPCHGAGGRGGPSAPPHKRNSFITEGSPEEIKRVIMNGRQGAEKKYPDFPLAMPGGLVTEAQADALVQYLKGPLQTNEGGAPRGRCGPGEHRGRRCGRGMR